MIIKRGKQVVAIMRGNKVVQAVYHGAILVWQAIRSCFGTGIWKSDKPWIGDDNWKNNK